MSGLLMGLGLIAAIIVFGIYRVVQRGYEMRELVDQGAEVTGRVVSKHIRRSHKSSLKTRLLEYAYRDAAGVEHRHRSMVPLSVWVAHDEGSAFAVVYSKARPSISAPKYLVDSSRQALKA